MISLKKVSKAYKKYNVHYNSLKNFLLHFRKYKRNVAKIDTLDVIKDLDLEIKESEILCVVGANGVGKSTLAKLIAGTEVPTSGTIRVDGKVVPFLQLGVAFSNELTGVDNLYLNGVMLGLSLKYLKENKEKIFGFAEVEEFMDTPLKYYSSGMQLRLAFSIAMHAHGDIYIFDEILAVGDASFKKKCFAAFDRILAENKTIIIVTHDFNFAKKHATKLLVMTHSWCYLMEDVRDVDDIDNMSDLLEYCDNKMAAKKGGR